MGKRADGLAHFMLSPVNDAFTSGVEIARCVSVYDHLPIGPYLASLEELPLLRDPPSSCMPRSIIMGETSITKKATNIKLHAQNSMERKARKVHF